MQDEKIIKLKEAMNDETFEERVAMCQSPEELYSVLEEKSIGFSKEEVNQMYDVIANSLSEDLSEIALDDVTGGFGIVGAACVVGGMYIAGRLYGSYAKRKIGYCR